MDREASTSHNVLERMLLDESAEPRQLPLSLLEDITNHFSLDHEIGRGGFAVVYKGIVGQGMVAVKKLSSTYGIHENKFLEEINCLIKAKHKNIVRFLGYCSDSQGEVLEYEGKHVMAEQRNWLLCFDYARNGSLDKHITGASCGLNWWERYRIIRGICQGLRFLHDKRILHIDLKPANVLLDGRMVPKITDFGLSRCLTDEQTRAITQNITGTLGYTDPEYLKTGQITFASDIYSLGVIIMEILTGVRRYDEDESVLESWMNRLGASEGDMQLEQVKVCSKIGIECMDLDPKKRPVIRHIIDRLDKASADYPDVNGISSSLVEWQISLPRERFGGRTGNFAAGSLQKVDAEEPSEILEDDAKRLHGDWIDDPAIPIVTGFLGQGWKCAVTTLGWGGSDLIDTSICKTLGLREIQVWKDVDGILTCDPNIYANAATVPHLTFEEAAEIAYFGGQVLPPQLMRMARQRDLTVRVKNSNNRHAPGTVITKTRDWSKSMVTSIVLKSNVTMLDIMSTRVLEQFGFFAKVFSILKDLGIPADSVATSETRISLMLDPSKLWIRELIWQELDNVVEELEKIAVVHLLQHRSIISLIGNVMKSSLIIEKAFNVLRQNCVNVQMMSHGASKVGISLVVHDSEAKQCVQALHLAFFENGFLAEVEEADLIETSTVVGIA